MVDNLTETAKNPKNNKPVKIVLIVVAALILIITVSWYFSRVNGELQEGTVVVKAGDTVLGQFTVADLEKLPQVEKEMRVYSNCNGACGNAPATNSQNGEEDSVLHLYTGVPLSVVLDSIDPEIKSKYQKVITKGIDYYSQVLEMADVEKADYIYVVYRDYGKPLITKDNKDGSLQVVLTGDKYGKRFTKWLISLELQ